MTVGDRLGDIRQWVRDQMLLLLPGVGPSVWVIGHAAIVIAFAAAALGRVWGR